MDATTAICHLVYSHPLKVHGHASKREKLCLALDAASWFSQGDGELC